VTDAGYISIPARARDEVSQLADYLEQGLSTLRDIGRRPADRRSAVPSVILDDLRAIVRMTEAATMRVLDETEALVDDGRAAARLLADIGGKAGAVDREMLAKPMAELGALVERSNARAMEIMSALEFQDLTSQKVQRTFAVLEEVLVRLGTIQRLLQVDRSMPPAAAPGPGASQGGSGQRLADELMVDYVSPLDV
jgi:chemotaxis regulatin CheY-phosphate phosphatase CheZ